MINVEISLVSHKKRNRPTNWLSAKFNSKRRYKENNEIFIDEPFLDYERKGFGSYAFASWEDDFRRSVKKRKLLT